jgi:hypothetical protein
MYRVALGHFHLPIWWMLGDGKLTTHFYLMPRLRRHGTILPLSHILSWFAEGQLRFHSQKMDKILTFIGIRKLTIMDT